MRQFFTDLSGSSQLSSFLQRFEGSNFQFLAFRPERGTQVFKVSVHVLKKKRILDDSNNMNGYDSGRVCFNADIFELN